MSEYRWLVTPQSQGKVSLEDYVSDFHHIYENTDSQRDVTDVLLNLISSTSMVSESVRRKRYWKVSRDLANVIAWLCGFAAKLGSNLEGSDRIFAFELRFTDAVWNKYPGLCPVCFSRQVKDQVRDRAIMQRLLSDKEVQDTLEKFGLPGGTFQRCFCMSAYDDPETRHEIDPKQKSILSSNMAKLRLEYASKRRDAFKPTGYVSYFENMFLQIYGANIRNTSFEDIVFHLQEEVGEVSEALTRLYTFNKDEHPLPDRKLRGERIALLCEECADVISWIFALILKVRFMIIDAEASTDSVSGASAEETENVVREPGGSFESREPTLFSVVWSGYGGDGHLRCGDICRESICVCPWHIARKPRQVSEILMR